MLRLTLVALFLLVSACSHKEASICLQARGPDNGYLVTVACDGFRFSFQGRAGDQVVGPHPDSGLLFGGVEAVSADLKSSASMSHAYTFTVTNERSEQASVHVRLLANNVRISVEPHSTTKHGIRLRTAGLMGPVYGLADDGHQVNVFGVRNQDSNNDGGHDRFVSTFAIAPVDRFAQVVMVQQDERQLSGDNRNVPHIVTLDDQETAMEVSHVYSVEHFNYFLGTPREIYQAFSRAKRDAGYPDVRPAWEMFGLGWEAWPLLSWQTNAEAVRQSVSEFLLRGYPLSWAVVGSGFWEEGGTTTSFGRWNEADDKYPDPEAFKTWFRERDIQLMLGLRTQFVDGLGMNSGAGRDGSFGVYMEHSDTPREYMEGMDRGFFADNGRDLFRTRSGVFPKWDEDVPVLDSDNPEAVEWYAEASGKWGVAGWKEDTMLTADSRIYHDGHWNPIMQTLHERGDLVMARNAYVSSPGSVQRLNDTDGEEDRIPRLVLAYGASGAPNVYTDIIGNLDQENAQYLQRHAKLQALTAAMSFGIEPWTLGQEAAANIKAAALWHHAYRPYLYSAALKSYQTGYPFTAIPLPIAYPGDLKTHNLHEQKMWQWMIDESMLAHPLFDATNKSWLGSVYLPEGDWINPNTSERFTGPITLRNHDYSGPGIPVFIGGKGVTVREGGEGQLYAEIWPVGQAVGTQYEFQAPGNDNTVISSWITLNITDHEADALVAEDRKSGLEVQVTRGDSGQWVFPLNPGRNYIVKMEPAGS